MIRVTSLAGLAMMAVGALSAAPASAQVGGSYRATCRDVEQRGPYLSALCRDVRGNYVQTQLDTRGCGGGVSNSNGRLTCGGGGGGGYGRRDRDEDRYEGRRRSYGDDDGYRRPRY